MATNPALGLIVFILLASLASSFAELDDQFLADAVVRRPHNVTDGHGRTLQEEILEMCPINVENLKYDKFTESCRGPNWPDYGCCHGFMELVCPVAHYVSDAKNDCRIMVWANILDRQTVDMPDDLIIDACKRLDVYNSKQRRVYCTK